MMRILVTRELAKALGRHVKPARTGEADLLWRADLKIIGMEPCVVLQEQQTQYILLLCGLSGEDFARFPQLLQDRFWRELASICQQAGLYDKATLIESLQALSEEQFYHLDPEPPEEGKIISVMEKLERRVLHDDLPLPTDGKAAFDFGFLINTRLSKQAAQNGDSNPAEGLGNLCLNLIEMRQEAEKVQSLVVSVDDNVVSVDFSRRH